MPPLTPDEFELGRPSVEAAVLWFLKQHAPIAFTAEEIMFELGALGVILDSEDIRQALLRAETYRRVESAGVEPAIYYRYYRPPLGFRPEG